VSHDAAAFKVSPEWVPIASGQKTPLVAPGDRQRVNLQRERNSKPEWRRVIVAHRKIRD
jgi:hypothetical protein